jgi:hypothetical protein
MFSRDQLKRAASLTEEDFAQLGKCRRPHNRYSLEPDPRNLPLSINRKYGNSLRSCEKVRENRVISE